MLLRKGMGDLFVNLARRNQSLVQRQLELLDDLERNEHDPAALDALFKLDHMATRMRRNAESLLVLSGAEQPRQWQQPIAPHRRRARRRRRDRRLPPGRARRHRRRPRGVRAVRSSDVAHLLAELLENATSFSPPDDRRRGVGRGVRHRLRARGLRPGHRHAARPHRRGQPAARQAARRRPRALAGPRPPRGRRRSPPATASASSCARARPVGLVALVALPTAILEPRPVSAPAAPPPRGQPRLLARPRRPTARPSRSARVAWCRARPTSRRWRSGAGRVWPTPAPRRRAGRRARADARGARTSAGSTRRRTTRRATTSRPLRRAVRRDRRPTRPSMRRRRRSKRRRSTRHRRPPAHDAAGRRHRRTTPPPVVDDAADAAARADADEGALPRAAPLPTRVPGQHLSHHPTARRRRRRGPEPTRCAPYRVHELLTRHAQGKRRGPGRRGAPDRRRRPVAGRSRSDRRTGR